ncbi:MAG: hypothetical protein IKZ07_00225 [Akkermansia sp.]|nr:hypothetical protein [Akkermansia sp.]
MNKKRNDITPEEEEKIIKMLSLLRVEPAPEADFEGRFLEEFKRRLAVNNVTMPARARLWEHVAQFFENIGVRRLAMAATSLFALVFVVVALMNGQPDGGVPKAVASVNTPIVEQVAPERAKVESVPSAKVVPYNVVASGTYESLLDDDEESEDEEKKEEPQEKSDSNDN